MEQKQQLDELLFRVQILLDEMGLNEIEEVQEAYDALASVVDEVLNESY
jgi:hypothetical protein